MLVVPYIYSMFQDEWFLWVIFHELQNLTTLNANWAVIKIKTNYKGLIMYVELLNALYLTELNKR
jgi:hypothetical protein